MRKKAKQSAYAQLRDKKNIIDFAREKEQRTYRLIDRAENGKPTLKIVMPSVVGAEEEKAIDISYLLGFPNLSEAFSEALLESIKVSKIKYVTADGKCRELKIGFMRYIETVGRNIQLSEITSAMAEEFYNWLNRPEKTYKLQSKKLLTMTFAMVMDYLLKSPRWSTSLSPNFYIRKNIWGGEPDDRERTKIVSLDDYRGVYQACQREMVATMARVREMRSLMNEKISHPIALRPDSFPEHAYNEMSYKRRGAKRSAWKDNPYKDLGLCLAAIRNRTPGVLLSITELTKMQDKLLLNLIEQKKPFGGIPSLYKTYYPYSRDLIPFILMLAIHLDYNLETLLSSKLDDFQIRLNDLNNFELHTGNFSNPTKSETLGIDSKNIQGEQNKKFEFIANPRKNRSNGIRQTQIRPATSDADNPAEIYNFIVEWTSFIRPLVPTNFTDRLFLYATQTGDRRVGGFAGQSTVGNDRNFREGLEKFYLDHSLEPIAFSRFRVTGLDITDMIFGGDIKAKQAAGNHASPDTTYRHYTTDAQEQRGDESLAYIAQNRQRWRESLGKSDPRNKPDGTDHGAATPGWKCADPYSGPFSHGKLCGAYGQCPNCIHASIAKNDPYACAQAWNLLFTVTDAASTIAPDAWLERWAPVKQKLEVFWLPAFANTAFIEAQKLNLRRLPPVE